MVTRDLTRPASGPIIASYAQLVNTDRMLVSASGRCVTSIRSAFLNEKRFHDFTTFSTLAQMC
jgi:hypothetical protein